MGLNQHVILSSMTQVWIQQLRRRRRGFDQVPFCAPSTSRVVKKRRGGHREVTTPGKLAQMYYVPCYAVTVY